MKLLLQEIKAHFEDGYGIALIVAVFVFLASTFTIIGMSIYIILNNLPIN